MEMEMEMVMIEALRMEDERGDSEAEACDAHVVNMVMGKPSSSPSSFSILESILDLALARFVPRHMEVEMGEAFMAAVDAKELEMMMIMLKPLDAQPKPKSRRCMEQLISLDRETEMVHMDV